MCALGYPTLPLSMSYLNIYNFLNTQSTSPEDWYSHLMDEEAEAQSLQDSPDHTSHCQGLSPNQSSATFLIAYNIFDGLFHDLEELSFETAVEALTSGNAYTAMSGAGSSC